MNIIDRMKLYFVKKEAIRMFDSIKLPLQKYAPAVIAALSVVLVAVGFVYGPVDIPVGIAMVHIPAVDAKTLLSVLWPLVVAVLHHVHMNGNGAPPEIPAAPK